VRDRENEQYTKRLVAGLLIPHSVIRLDYLLELASAEHGEPAT
jgi:hypothetical protein